MITLEFERGAVEAAAGGELGFEGLEDCGKIVGAIGAWGEAAHDGDPLASALFALHAEGLVLGVELFAAEAIARAGALAELLLAAFADDGLLEGCAVKEAGHSGGR